MLDALVLEVKCHHVWVNEIGNLAAHEQRLTFFKLQSKINELAILYQI